MAVVLARRFVPETTREPGHFDVIGATTATSGSVALVYAFINAADHGWGSACTIARLRRRQRSSSARSSASSAAPAAAARAVLLRSRPVSRACHDDARHRRAVPDVLPAGAVQAATSDSARSSRGWLPAAEPGDLRDLPGHSPPGRRFGTWPLITTGAVLALVSLVWLRDPPTRERTARSRRATADQRRRRRPAVHAAHGRVLAGVEPRHAGPRPACSRRRSRSAARSVSP